MYSMNGIDLTGGEFNELSWLVHYLDEYPVAISRRAIQTRMHGDGRRLVGTYCSLHGKGLIDGAEGEDDLRIPAFLFADLTKSGIDFIRDYEADQSAKAAQEKVQRCHEYKLAAFQITGTTILGILASIVTTYIMNSVFF